MLDARVQLPPFSMWSATPIYEVNGPDGPIIAFGLLQDAAVADPTDSLYTVPQAGVRRLDLISHVFYGVPDLWWVIARVNNLTDPLTAVPVGTVLRIPAKARLAQEGLLGV